MARKQGAITVTASSGNVFADIGLPNADHVALLMRNRSGTLSAEQLTSFITSLGRDVEIRVKPTRRRRGQVSVIVAA